MQKKQVDFELAKKIDALPHGDGWIYELKYDGWRIMAFVDDDVRLITRNQNDVTSKFSSIADALVDWQTKKKFIVVLDGELISETFGAIRSGENLTYAVFDLLFINGVDMRDKPLVERKAVLQKLLKTAPAQIHYCEHLETMTRSNFEVLCQNGHEGVIIKRADSVYTGSRSGNWLKLKNENFSRTKIETPEITSPDKKVFSGVTKADIAEYYRAVFPLIFPHIKGREVSQMRCPDGVGNDDKPCFYKRNPPLVIESLEQLLQEVQMNTIEFHVGGALYKTPDKPDTMVFDIDPDSNATIYEVRRAAKDLRSILKELSLEATIKTSGGKGFHIMVDFPNAKDWDSFKEFAKGVATVMEQKWPDRYTTNIRKDARVGKIFIDYLRNSPKSTTVAPYSVRAKEGATISMPISWAELDTVLPDGFTVKNVGERLKFNN